MAKYLVETYYTCTFKVNHYLDDINEDELKNLEKRDFSRNLKNLVLFVVVFRVFSLSLSGFNSIRVRLGIVTLPTCTNRISLKLFWLIKNLGDQKVWMAQRSLSLAGFGFNGKLREERRHEAEIMDLILRIQDEEFFLPRGIIFGVLLERFCISCHVWEKYVVNLIRWFIELVPNKRVWKLKRKAKAQIGVFWFEELSRVIMEE
jgi:hypothetical protein